MIAGSDLKDFFFQLQVSLSQPRFFPISAQEFCKSIILIFYRELMSKVVINR